MRILKAYRIGELFGGWSHYTPPAVASMLQVQWSGRRSALFLIFLLWTSGVLLAACDSRAPVGEISDVVAETPVSTEFSMAGEVTPAENGATAVYRPLVLWVPEFLDVEPSDNAGSVLSAAITQFEQVNPGVQVELAAKAERGEASLFNYLLSAQKAAPAILPDLMVLNTQQLWQVAELGLVQPISASTALQMVDFYDFALQAVTYNEQVLGVPYAADMPHLVYHQEQILIPPRTWADLLAADTEYILPIKNRAGESSGSLLTQYVGAGGQLLEGGTVSDPDAAAALLEFLATANAQSVIPDQVVEYTDLNGTWSDFMANGVAMADASARSYLSQREVLDGVVYGQLPSADGASHSVTTVWAFAILSEDPEQRVLALELIQTLLAPSVQGPWTQFAHFLPTHRSALEAWSSGQPYYEFLGQQLEQGAVAIPNGRLFAQFSRRLADAGLAVLQGQLSPEEALAELRATP